MRDKEFKAILDREKAVADVQAHFKPQIELLVDLVNYGSNLIPRAYRSSSKMTGDVVVCGVLLKQIVAMTDAVEVLVRSGIVQSAFLPARAAFEASLYVDWMLSENMERKANCYVVATLRQERKWALRSIKGTLESEIFNSVIAELGVDMHTQNPSLMAAATKHLGEVNKNLSQDILKAIDEEFNKKSKKGKFDVEWYKVVGALSLRQIAKEVGRLPQYDFVYSKGSEIMHSGLFKDHVRFAGNSVRFGAIRGLRQIDNFFSVFPAIVIATYANIIKHYRPDEAPAFARHYVDEWREPFLKMKSVVEAGD